MLLRGSTPAQTTSAAVAVAAGIVAIIVVTLLEQRFGLLVALALVLVLVWVVHKYEERSWKRL